MEGTWRLHCATLTGKDLLKKPVAYTITLQAFDEEIKSCAKPIGSQVGVYLNLQDQHFWRHQQWRGSHCKRFKN
jgi:hypothetical protein